MPHDPMVLEAVAQAIAPAGYFPDIAMQRATAILDAIEATGRVVVPLVPTPRMVSEANRLNHPRDEDVWATMVAARPGAQPASQPNMPDRNNNSTPSQE